MSGENDVTESLIDDLERTWPEESPIAANLGGDNDVSSDSDGTPKSEPQSTQNPAQNVSGFNPVIHAVGPDGKPIFNQDGSLRKKRGRKAGSVATQQPTGDDQQLAKARTVAITMVETLFMFGRSIGGDEWEPLTQPIDERENLYSAWTAYFLTKPDVEIPPWMMAAMATGMYALPRLSKPVTAGRLERVTNWFKVKIFDRIWRTKWRKQQSSLTGFDSSGN